ncbi:hypothetical protein DTL21_21870 [Bremerella cremea]|uniref:Uncharacterized protein n=1 Tax=Blastopirellula marina TaxID=124 RepID=A0A2S8FKX3_9BACT|nr:hypothetical protein C5Y83_21845 [Blastopirellula marina]RCS45895.1 hypothetical protein DTL21_21870 [Bremerella cremea]
MVGEDSRANAMNDGTVLARKVLVQEIQQAEGNTSGLLRFFVNVEYLNEQKTICLKTLDNA